MVDHPLKKYRDGVGITMEALGLSVGVSKSTISRIESGNQAPSLELIRRLVEETGLSADDFLYQPQPQPQQSSCAAGE